MSRAVFEFLVKDKQMQWSIPQNTEQQDRVVFGDGSMDPKPLPGDVSRVTEEMNFKFLWEKKISGE